MKKLLLATLIVLTLTMTACGASSKTPQAGPANQSQAMPLATQLIVGTFKLDGTPQAITADEAKQLLPLWQVYKDLLKSDTAAPEEISALVDQVQETMSKEQTQAITDMNLTQRDIFTLMQEKGVGFNGQQRNGSNSGGNTTNSGTSTTRGNGTGGFTPPEGGFPGGGFPGGGPDGGFTGNQSRNSRSSTSNNRQSGTSTAVRQTQFNPASLLLDPLIELLKQKAGS